MKLLFLSGAVRMGLLMAAGALCAVAAADEHDQSYRLGAFAGAMRYCEDRHEGPDRRYRWAQLRAFDEIASMARGDRLRALAARERALERGRFFGERLDPRSCHRLLRLSEWKRFRHS